jgi:hypothetical protein
MGVLQMVAQDHQVMDGQAGGVFPFPKEHLMEVSLADRVVSPGRAAGRADHRHTADLAAAAKSRTNAMSLWKPPPVNG